MNPRVATGKGLEDTPTCDSNKAPEISIRDSIGIGDARNFQGPASGVWGDEGSRQSVLLSISPAPYGPLRTLIAGRGCRSPRGLSS